MLILLSSLDKILAPKFTISYFSLIPLEVSVLMTNFNVLSYFIGFYCYLLSWILFFIFLKVFCTQ